MDGCARKYTRDEGCRCKCHRGNGTVIYICTGWTGDRRGAYRVWWGDFSETEHLEDLGVDGRIILKWIFRKWNESVDWIDLVQNSDRWRAVVNAVMNCCENKTNRCV
jgi:hypothetical protein